MRITVFMCDINFSEHRVWYKSVCAKIFSSEITKRVGLRNTPCLYTCMSRLGGTLNGRDGVNMHYTFGSTDAGKTHVERLLQYIY